MGELAYERVDLLACGRNYQRFRGDRKRSAAAAFLPTSHVLQISLHLKLMHTFPHFCSFSNQVKTMAQWADSAISPVNRGTVLLCGQRNAFPSTQSNETRLQPCRKALGKTAALQTALSLCESKLGIIGERTNGKEDQTFCFKASYLMEAASGRGENCVWEYNWCSVNEYSIFTIRYWRWRAKW